MKIYASVLSDEDILDSYKSSYILDKNSNMYCTSIEEKSSSVISLNKKGIIECEEIDEVGLYGMEEKVLDDGSVWAKVFYHYNRGGTVLFTSNEEALHSNTSDKFSRLFLLEKFRATDGKFEFLLEYPDDLTGYNRWKQTTNPIVETAGNTGVIGYEGISISWSVNYWGGLEYNGGVSSFIDGSVYSTSWFFAIGCKTAWNNSIPGPNVAVSLVELWVRVDTVDLEDINNFNISNDNIFLTKSFNEI
jgi:hypothetical protein